MPTPTTHLMEGAAKAIYEQLREFWDETGALGGPRKQRTPLLKWNELDEDHHQRWINAAKSAYGIFAVAGGAQRVRVQDIVPDSQADH